jgi:hypothetical protein
MTIHQVAYMSCFNKCISRSSLLFDGYCSIFMSIFI